MPILSANYGYRQIVAVVTKWKNLEQERIANLKLSEISVQIDIGPQISAYSNEFKEMLTDLSEEYPKKSPSSLPLSEMAAATFRTPFPEHELWIFMQTADTKATKLIFNNQDLGGKRAAELVFAHLLAENRGLTRDDQSQRRDEKMLRRLFGAASIGKVLANNQRGVATPVIYNEIPSFLTWDYVEQPNGQLIGFCIIVKRNQPLQKNAYAIAARKTGIGNRYAGGFIALFNENDDHLFPESVASSALFRKWRNSVGVGLKQLKSWEEKGFPWGKPLGKYRLYSRILPQHEHVAFILMPDLARADFPLWLKTLNLLAAAMIILFLIRGYLLDVWPFATILSRFIIAFTLAITLPVALYISSATAYIYESYNADENQIEENLTSCLLDFDAGKEYLENAYISVFSQMMSDTKIKQLLADKGLAASEDIFARIKDLATACPEKIPISGIAIYDIAGNARFHASGAMLRDDFVSLAGFYGLPFTSNLRLLVSKQEPDLALPEQKKDPGHLAAMQSFRRDSRGIEYEIERFRNRVIKTSIGRGHLEYIYDFLTLAGKNRFTLMIAWLDSDINEIVLKQNALKLALSRPNIQISGFRKTVSGVEPILEIDRSITPELKAVYAKTAKSTLSVKSGMVKSLLANRSVLAYISSNFANTVLIAAQDHYEKNQAHAQRLSSFFIIGLFGMIILIVSGSAIYARIVMPLQHVKSALDQIDEGHFPEIMPSPRKDEIGLLSNEFSAMVKGLEERQRLASMLSDQALSAISAESDGSGLRSEALNGVVLISDIRDFTTTCEKYEAKTVTRLLNLHFAEMAAVITNFGGRIYKFIGDAIEAVFIEDPLEARPAAHRASMAAAALLMRLKKINQRRQSNRLFSYRIGVGLAAGSLIGGEVGSKNSRLDYAMFGDAFTNAEKLEAASKKFPDCPMLADASVAEQCTGCSIHWIEDQVDGTTIFRPAATLDELDQLFEAETGHFSQADQIKLKSRKEMNNQNDWLSRNAASGRKLVYLAGMLCIIFPALAGLITLHTSEVSAQKSLKNSVIEQCNNALTRLNVAELEPVLLEQYLDKICEKASHDAGWNRQGLSSEVTASQAASISNSLQIAGLKPSVFAVVHKPGDHQIFIPDKNWKSVAYQGALEFKEIYEELLKKLLESAYLRGWPDTGKIREYMPLIMGSNMVLSHIYLELYAKVTQINRAGIDEYFYWQPLAIRNQKKIKQAKSLPRIDVRSKGTENYILNTGAILCIFEKSLADANQLVPLHSLLEHMQLSYATVAENSTIIAATGPFVNQPLSFHDAGKSITGWHITSTVIELGNRNYRVFLGKQLQANSYQKTNLFAALLIVLLTMAALRAWRSAINEGSGIAASFSWQLWLGLFAAAIVPLSTVYTVNEWFAIEQKELRPVEERLKMLNYLDRVERRQFLQQLANWHVLSSLTRSHKLKQIVNTVGKLKIPANVKNLDQLLARMFSEQTRKSVAAYFNDMLIFSRQGWQHSYQPPGIATYKKDDFRRFLDFFVNNLFSQLGSGKQPGLQNEQSLAKGVKAEITRDSGLAVFRNLFGSDAYFTLVNGIDLKQDIFMASGHGLLSLMAAPGLEKPETLVFWLFFDRLNSWMQKIIRLDSSIYETFTESRLRYGSLKMPQNGGLDTTSAYFARWAAASKMPICETTMFAGKKSLIEARLSRQNEIMMIVSFIPEEYYLDEIEGVRHSFFVLLLLSILAIILLTRFVASDLIGPIATLTDAVKKIASRQLEYRIANVRKDELGQMQKTFNTVARSLQEKALMGQMVSSAARRIAKDATSLREAESGLHLEASVIYLAVPHFQVFLQTMTYQELIADVREHIDKLCQIIIANGGEADKIMGEKILAWFYSPQGIAVSSNLAARALRQIKSAELAGELKFPINAGLHNGDVIAGLLGFGSQRDFTIIGDPVNTAARICSRAAELPTDRFLGSEAFVNCLDLPDVRYRDYGRVQLKGKDTTVNLKQIVFYG